MKTLKILATLAAVLMPLLACGAEDFPTHPIRIIVPYNAGGAGDVMARTIGKEISSSLGQAVIVENRPGASGMIGTTFVARAKGDPYTLLLGSSAEISINPSLYAKVNYQPETDLTPIAYAGKLPLVLVTNPQTRATSLKDILAMAKARPGVLAFGSAGVGQMAHLGMEEIMRQTGVRLVHVPYKGGSEAVLGVIGNQTQLFLSGLPPALPQIAAGKLRALAVSTTNRVPQLPDVPTISESGVSGFDFYNWFALFGPADIPPAVVEKLNAAVNNALASSEVQKLWEAQGIVSQNMTPTELRAFVSAETAKYKTLIKTANIKAD